MTVSTAFTLRPLERTTPSTALEGAFRIHLSAKELKNLNLSNADLVRLSTSTGPKGFAFAWLASQTNAGNKPIAKVTDLLRETYALSLNDPVLLEKANDSMWKPIKSIETSFTDSPGQVTKNASKEQLLSWVRSALENLDLIVPGCTVDVQPRGPGNRSKGPKLRLTIENIDPPLSTSSALYFEPVQTDVIAPSNEISKTLSLRSDKILSIKGDGIGGLTEHIGTINKSLAFLTSPAFGQRGQHLTGPTTYFIHGPEGTGKSLLLERLSECGWREVYRLDPEWLAFNSKGQIKAVSDIFKDALETQPSLILMDNLDKFLAKAEFVVCLVAELKKLAGTQVVVAAAARSVYDIDTSLRTASTFRFKFEVFPPNKEQRENVLREIIGPDSNVTGVNFASLAERSHGFVGRDIYDLCLLARDHRVNMVYDSLEFLNKGSLGDVLEADHFVTQEDFDAVIDQVQPTVLQDSILEVPKVRWTDIAGLDHVRKALENIMIRPLKYPDFDAKIGVPQSRKGVLLYGPPGCAKTLTAQAVATEFNQNFLAVKGSELIKMYVGESERAIRDVFRRARAAKPCIIFFDEIDSIGKSREKTQDSGLNVVATLLNELDGIEALKEVFIIGATNRPDILDSALIRTGRFDAHIHIGLPNEEARKQIFEIQTRRSPLAHDVDLNNLASKTAGSSGADIKGLCSAVVDMAFDDYTRAPESPPELKMCHFLRALENHVPHTMADEAVRYENWRPGKSLSAE
ncbi:P-loop containing nucleoside triphosphate hydrolase protein [Massariosphaeria phaeospora]|uniref:P-loop containing nucleoside triphosphate hydrolase protein n=1 Tax=Massariosphaeria phaeospora TaxID=100035 RepID=A0A7C8M7R0_9PLEO|nr:P-loop containing nucleoside triphosphate hydrolase protein [Massariosphaeria phaeospora]